MAKNLDFVPFDAYQEFVMSIQAYSERLLKDYS